MQYGELNIDFFVLSENKSLEYLSIYDVSNWSFLADKKSIIDIQLPNSNEVVRNYYSKNAINNFNSNTLAMTCGEELLELPDGIYTISVESEGGIRETRKYFRTTKVEHLFDKFLINNKIDCDLSDCILEEGLYFIMYLKGLEALMRKCEYDKALELYNRLLKIVDECNKCNTCK